MRKMIVVAVREYMAAVKSKAFVFSLVAMPILWGGSIVLQMVLRDKVDTKDKRIAVLDYTHQLYDAVAAAAQARNEHEIFEGEGATRKQVKPRYLVECVKPTGEDQAQAKFDLSERVRRADLEDIMAFVIIGPEVIKPGADPALAAIDYHSNSPTYDDIQDWVATPLNERIQQLRLRAANLDAGVVEAATRHMPVANLGLVSRDQAGKITAAEKTNEIANMFMPLGLMMLMLMVVMIGASPLVQSVLEEKTMRVAEVLLGSVPPFQLMMGKLVGMVGVSLTIVIFYLVGAFYALHQAGYGAFFPAHVIWWFVVFQALAVIMYGSLFIAAGAAVSDMKEAQSLITPIMVLAFLPMFVWINIVKEPTSSFALAMSLIPPATPMLMMIRQAAPPGIPAWQPALGILLVLLTTIACVFAAGRIFRVGILMQGKGAKLGELVRWVFRG